MTHGWNDRERRLILASRSPRRAELLQGVGFFPIVRAEAVDERRRTGEDPVDYTLRLSREKVDATCRMLRGAAPADASPFALGADTVVVLGGAVLEKPRDEAEAAEMLRRLSGQWHTVVTSFTVRSLSDPEQAVSTAVEAGVRFKELTEDEITRYIATREPMDKAGSYGIQRLGGFLVRELRGSYFAVVGLPVCEVVEALVALGAVTRFPFPGEVRP